MKVKKHIIGLFALFMLVFCVYFSIPFILDGMGRFLIVRDQLKPADAIVVLGGDNNGERVAYGVELYKKGFAPKMLMSGGPLQWHLTSAEWMRKQAISLGVPPGAIFIQDRSLSTLEDVLLTVPIIRENGYKSVLLVTSPTHSRRALWVFKKQLKKNSVEVLSAPVVKSQFKLNQWWSRHEDTQQVMWEYVSLVYYFFQRKI